MYKIALAYSDTRFPDDKVFDESFATQQIFRPVDCKPAVEAVTSDNGTMLNGRNYSSRLYTHKIFNFVISSDELTSDDTFISGIILNAKMAFLINFWKANYKYLYVFPVAAGTYYQRVITDGGEFPVSYIEDIELFPEVTLKLTLEKPNG